MEKKVKRDFVSLPKAEIIRFSNEFTNEFLVDEKKQMLNIPIDAIRILFKIVSDLRNAQFQDRQEAQLSLFESEFLNEHNTFARFKINLNEVALNGNTERVREALEFLTNYKKDWYESVNKDGKRVKSYGGLITAPSYSKGETVFLISSYWLKKLSYLPQYNSTLYRLAFNVSNNKHILFYFWLITIPDQGTSINYKSINNRYVLNYPNAKELCKNFLKQVKKTLDIHSLKSFNYSYIGEQISIVPYVLSNLAVEEEKTKKYIVISQRTHYWKIRHKLSETQVKAISTVLKNHKPSISLLNKAYKLFVSDARKEGKKMPDYTGAEFMTAFQERIKLCYMESNAYKYAPGGHPKIL